MENVDPTTGMAVFIILAAIVTICCSIINTIVKVRASNKATPPTGESLATIGAKLNALDRDLEETKRRHTCFEAKMTTQLSDIWKQYDKLLGAVAENGGILKSFIHEMRNWRTSHDAQDNHS